MKKLGESPLVVSAYPVAWRIEVVDEDIHRGFEYVRSELYVIPRDHGVKIIASIGEPPNGPGMLIVGSQKTVQRSENMLLLRNCG